MDESSIEPLVSQLSEDVDTLHAALTPLLQTSISDSAGKLPLLDKAKLYVLVTYAIESLLFSSLRLSDTDAKSHPVFTELTRVKQYFAKIQAAESGPATRNLNLDKGAAGRIIKHGLAGNVKYDAERKARMERERAGADAKLKELNSRIEKEKRELKKSEGKKRKVAESSSSSDSSSSESSSESESDEEAQTSVSKKRKVSKPDEGTSSSASSDSESENEGEDQDEDTMEVDTEPSLTKEQQKEIQKRERREAKAARNKQKKENKAANNSHHVRKRGKPPKGGNQPRPQEGASTPAKNKRRSKREKNQERMAKVSKEEQIIPERSAKAAPSSSAPNLLQSFNSKKQKSDKAPKGSHEAFQALLNKNKKA